MMRVRFFHGVLLASILLLAFQNCGRGFSSDQGSESGTPPNQGQQQEPPGSGENEESNQTRITGLQSNLNSLKPAMAVRTANCISCHGNTIKSPVITDFGHGDPWFFSLDLGSPVAGDGIYALRIESNQTQTKWIPFWGEAEQFVEEAKLIVPKADLGFKYAQFAPSWAPNLPWLQATTLSQLLTDVENMKTNGKAEVVEKEEIYIGVPTAATIKSIGGLTATQLIKFSVNSSESPPFSGIIPNAGGYYVNTGTTVCDGDLFLDSTLFLKDLKLQTVKGCRIHTTGPIVVQGSVTYLGGSAQSNLQLLSAELISMGVGTTHCEPNGVGWYGQNHVANPVHVRLIGLAHKTSCAPDASFHCYKDVLTRAASSYDASLALGQKLASKVSAIQGLKDASCTGRSVTFERLLLVAPQIHSRYQGNFKGVIIAEYPMFSLGSFFYSYDSVFDNVPVLPKMPSEQILVVR